MTGLSFKIVVGLAAALTGAAAGDPYVSEGFLTIPSAVRLGAMSAVDVAPDGAIYVLHRGEPPILVFDSAGRMVNAFGDGLFHTAHGLRVDRSGDVWTTDNGRHVIRRFSAEGRLIATYGREAVPGAGADRFRSPDDIAFASNGDVYVADAGNGQIVHLRPDGSYVGEWGRKGAGEGEFAAAHGIAVDSADRVYIADRGNHRVQVFSLEGRFIAAWSGFGNPFGVLAVGDALLVSDGDAHRLTSLRLGDGGIAATWGDPETLKLPHLMAVGPDGRLYVTEVEGRRVQIFGAVQ